MAGALQIVNAFKQSLTGSFTFDAFAVSAPDSLVVANVPDGTKAYLAEVWAVDDTTSLITSIFSFGFSDTTLGMQGGVPFLVDGNGNARASNVSPSGLDQPIYSGNTLTVQGGEEGGGGGNANIVYLLRYANLPGVNANLVTAAFVRNNTRNLLGVECDVDASSGAQGAWSDGVALNAGGDRLDADKYYAIIGFNGTVPFAACGVTAFETGQLRIGSPVVGDGEHDTFSLLNLSERYNDTFIPVIRGANQGNTFVYVADPKATTGKVIVQLAELTTRPAVSV